MKAVLIPETKKIFVWNEAVHMGRSFAGLSLIVKKEMKRSPDSGELFLFRNKQRTYLKVLYWHKDGYCLFCKKLPAGHFDMENIENKSSIGMKEMVSLVDTVMLKLPKVKE